MNVTVSNATELTSVLDTDRDGETPILRGSGSTSANSVTDTAGLELSVRTAETGEAMIPSGGQLPLSAPLTSVEEYELALGTAEAGETMPPMVGDSTSGISVSNAAELKAALDTAKSGDKILLKGGEYGNFYYANKSFSSTVTIESANASDPAVFTAFGMKAVSHVSIDGVKFDYRAANGAPYSQANFQLNGVDHVAISHSVFDGAAGTGLGAALDGSGVGIGLFVRGGNNVTVSANEFTGFYRGAVFGGASQLRVEDNNVHDMSSDGFDFADADNVVIAGNRIHDFHRPEASSAHPDMIQFWTAGTTSPSTNVQILNNFLYQGEGGWTQSIFMRNEMVDSGGAGKEMFYSNIKIAGNVIQNGHYHGITVGETSGLEIANNTIVQSPATAEGGTISVPSVNVASSSSGVWVHDNILPRLGGGLAAPHVGWTVADNDIVQIDNPQLANYAGYLFADGLDRSPEWTDFALVGKAAQEYGNVGAVHPAEYVSSGEAWGFLLADQPHANGKLVEHLQVGNIFSKGAEIDLGGAHALWDFGDGATGSGLSVGHLYNQPGEYKVSALVSGADGETYRLEKTVNVHSVNYLDLDFESGLIDTSPEPNALKQANGATVVGVPGAHALLLNGAPVVYQSDSDFIHNPEFTLSADFKKKAGMEGQGGWLLYKSSSFYVALGADDATVTIMTTKGAVTLHASSIGIEDTDWHRIAVTFSGTEGVAKLMLDGKEVSTVEGLSGAVLAGSLSSDFVIGSPFHGSFNGLVDNISYLGDALTTQDFGQDSGYETSINHPTQPGAEPSAIEPDPAGGGTADLSNSIATREDGSIPHESHYGTLSGTGFDLL